MPTVSAPLPLLLLLLSLPWPPPPPLLPLLALVGALELKPLWSKWRREAFDRQQSCCALFSLSVSSHGLLGCSAAMPLPGEYTAVLQLVLYAVHRPESAAAAAHLLRVSAFAK